MLLKGIIDEDIVNYKKISMTLMFPVCRGFKCGEACQNKSLALEPNIEVSISSIYERYINNSLTKAIVLQGLEPFDTYRDVYELVFYFRTRKGCQDDIVIYSGYNKDELKQNCYLDNLSTFSNIIIKYGRYIPNNTPHYDEVLGVNLASDNQYAEVLSDDF